MRPLLLCGRFMKHLLTQSVTVPSRAHARRFAVKATAFFARTALRPSHFP